MMESILTSHNIDYYAVPEDADFTGKHNETIRNYTCSKVKKCDILICLIGCKTYSRPHVDREIHTALKGNVGVRLGIIGVLLPTRSDSLSKASFDTIPVKLIDNKDYVVWSDWHVFQNTIDSLISVAFDRSLDSNIQTNHSNPCMPVKSKIYYEN